ncbi:Spore wall protein 12 [Astathelohania contejeani]|uniref:Spore wall protein 12 n=1 Tax=Astathelohania contejeani TaxID=164912 RepID=A0ABQ7I282_9MICR|nr:Spore wall protein 12 [Thelohania contejeani]
MQGRMKNVMRQFSGIEYKRTHVSEEFDKTEQKYRLLRDLLVLFEDKCRKIMTYEHGGSRYKNMMEKLQVIGERINLNAFKLDNFYKETALVLKNISQIKCNSKLDTVCNTGADALDAMCVHKDAMNKEMEAQFAQLEKFKARSKTIDSKRNEFKNTRYDLEKLYKSTHEDDPRIAELNSKFEMLKNNTQNEMKEFIEDKSLAGIINEIIKAEADYHKECLKSLGQVKM